jgi:hypothetical protein
LSETKESGRQTPGRHLEGVALRESATNHAWWNRGAPYSELTMKHIQLNITAVLTFLALTASSLPLSAGEPIATTWNQVCNVAGGRELVVTTTTGEAVEGSHLLLGLRRSLPTGSIMYPVKLPDSKRSAA